MCAQSRFCCLPALLFITAFIVNVACAGTLEISVVGLNTELEKAVSAHLTLQRYLRRDVSPAQLRRLATDSESEAREVLETFGYYDANVSSRIEEHAHVARVTLHVTLGQPVTVGSKSVAVDGTAPEVEHVADAIDVFMPRVGQPFDHVRYESSKAAIEAALTDAGFLAAQLRTHEVTVSTTARSAAIDLRWTSGERYRFGEVHFSPTLFPPEFFDRFVPWQADEYFSGQKLLDLQQRLIDADYFSLVSVQPQREHLTALHVPIEVDLLAAKRSVYTASVYGSTDTGVGVQGGFARRWLNRSGHKFRADADYAQLKQEFSLGYIVPLRGPNYRNLSFAGSYRSETTDSSESRTTRLTSSETRQWHGFTRTLGLQLLAGDFEIGSERGNSVLLYGEGTLSRTRADDPAFPHHGYSVTLGARFAPESALADTSFAQVGMRAKWVTSFRKDSRLIYRASIAAMVVDDFDELPPELRFFAGGDRSIRGFDYQSIGSLNAAGDVIGGTYLGVGSVEYERYFRKNWGVAVFVDAGDAWLEQEFNSNIGAGMGLRWRSPIGAVRIDVGVPVESDISNGARLHIVIGPDL